MGKLVLFTFTLMLIVADSCFGQNIEPGKCPDVKPIENFEAANYLGNWYEVEKYFFLLEEGGECVTTNYELNDNGTIKVTYFEHFGRTGINITLVGTASFDESPHVSKFTLVFPSLPAPILTPYWVIGTDYTNYAVVWSCVDAKLFNSRSAWILTRERVPTSSTLNEAYAVFDKFNLTKSDLRKTSQENC